MNSYELSRNWFDFSFENPDLVKPIHTAIYFFAIEHCNRLGWKEKFGLPSQMVMEAIGVKNWRTYASGLNDLIEFGFIKLHEKSRNQYSSNIIAIVNFTKADAKALDKALQKHDTKQSKSTVSINKPNNKEQLTIELRKSAFYKSLTPYLETYGQSMLREFYDYWVEHGPNDKKMRFEKEKSFGLDRRLATWKKREGNFNKSPAKVNGVKFESKANPTLRNR